jgi:SsrA-binding protein
MVSTILLCPLYIDYDRQLMHIITQNKQAYFEYEILEKIEAGIVLTGDEVKSLRAHQVSLQGSFATVHAGELYLINCKITPYTKAYTKKEEETSRPRKLLLHKRQLNRIIGAVAKKGVTIVPLKLYLSDRSIVKVEIGMCRHKKAVDKKQVLKERDIRRETAREIKNIR